MKRLVLFMMAVMLLSITVNAQKKAGSLFLGNGNNGKGCQVGGRSC